MLNANHIKLTGQDNFQKWKKQAKNLLIMTELQAYVSSRVKKPIPIESLIDSNAIIHLDLVLVVVWEAKDEIALTFIHITIDNFVDQNIISVATSKDAWNTLLSLYERQDDTHIVMSKAKLFTIKFIELMKAFLSSIKEINNQLTTSSKLASNENLMTTTIHALPLKYNSFISLITRGGTLGTINFNQLESILL